VVRHPERGQARLIYPDQQRSQFELVLNLKTAKTLGVTILSTLLITR